MEIVKCKDCKWYVTFANSEYEPECFFHPPVVFAMGHSDKVWVRYQRPEVYPDDFCSKGEK
jgi:hypothetical protein